MASARNYMSVDELLRDYRWNRRLARTAWTPQRWHAAYQRYSWSWIFLLRKWGLKDHADLDAHVMDVIEGRRGQGKA